MLTRIDHLNARIRSLTSEFSGTDTPEVASLTAGVRDSYHTSECLQRMVRAYSINERIFNTEETESIPEDEEEEEKEVPLTFTRKGSHDDLTAPLLEEVPQARDLREDMQSQLTNSIIVKLMTK